MLGIDLTLGTNAKPSTYERRRCPNTVPQKLAATPNIRCASGEADMAKKSRAAVTGAATAATPSAALAAGTAVRLDNKAPIDLTSEAWARNLQGNILNGHGRDHTFNIFLRLPAGDAARRVVKQLCPFVTTAAKQESERRQFKNFGIPGKLFCNLFLSAAGYRILGHTDAELGQAFNEPPEDIRQVKSNFLDGMAAHAVEDLGDPPTDRWDFGAKSGDIHAMVLLADDDEPFLKRATRALVDYLEDHGCILVWVERGTALRTDAKEGIEHFGAR
jgi:deferrochelatase/peroxidase EfeB